MKKSIPAIRIEKFAQEHLADIISERSDVEMLPERKAAENIILAAQGLLAMVPDRQYGHAKKNLKEKITRYTSIRNE